jgi:hypothetical protein
MRTIEDIGREIKAKHPGKYDHLSDAEVGRRMFDKYPERYPDVSESLERFSPQALIPSVKALTKGFELPEHGVSYAIDRDIQIIVDHYHPNHGRLSAWWQRGKAESRSRLLSVLNDEQLQVIEQGAILEDAIIRKKKKLADYQMWVIQNAVTLRQIFVNEHLIDNALREGLTVEAHQPIVVRRLTDDLEITKHERLVQIELERRWKEIVQDLDAADLLEISELQLLDKMRERLVTLERERYQISKGQDPKPVKKRILARYSKDIKFLGDLIDARQAGRILSKDKETARRLAEGTPEGRADYPAAIDADDI